MGAASVTFNGTPATIILKTPTVLYAKVPAPVGIGCALGMVFQDGAAEITIRNLGTAGS